MLRATWERGGPGGGISAPPSSERQEVSSLSLRALLKGQYARLD